MSLFDRSHVPVKQTLPYSITFGDTKIKIIVGLGNPGKEYNLTRHNIGFESIDHFAKINNFPEFSLNKKFKAYVTENLIGSTKVILVKPETYMNLSGEAVQAASHFYKVETSNIVAVYDEISIPFGQIRTRVGGQSAGHNGVKSLIEHLGQDFGRIRIGIKNEYSDDTDTSKFVLAKFSKDEQKILPEINNEVANILTELIYGGILVEDTRKIII